jgi:hypothetical protein
LQTYNFICKKTTGGRPMMQKVIFNESCGLRVAFLGAQPFSKKRNFATATLKCFGDGSEAFPY